MDIRRLDDGRTVVEFGLHGRQRRIVQGAGSAVALEVLAEDATGAPAWISAPDHTRKEVTHVALELLADEALRLVEALYQATAVPFDTAAAIEQRDRRIDDLENTIDRMLKVAEEPGVGRYLDVSTVHAPSNEAVERAKRMAAALDGTLGSHWRVLAAYDCGFFGYVPEDDDEDEAAEEAGVPVWLTDIWRLARQKGCYLIRVDRDAPEHTGDLKLYREWWESSTEG